MMNAEANFTGQSLRAVLAASYERGDMQSIAVSLHVPQQRLYEWNLGMRRDPFSTCAEITERLRANGNAKSDEPFAALAQRLGYLPIKLADIEAPSHEEMATLCVDFADVVRTYGDNMADGVETQEEAGALISRLRELIGAAVAMERHESGHLG